MFRHLLSLPAPHVAWGLASAAKTHAVQLSAPVREDNAHLRDLLEARNA